MIISSDKTPLADIIAQAPDIIPVLNRFGVLLGVANDTIADVAIRSNIHAAFIIQLLNRYMDDDFDKHHRLEDTDKNTLIVFLKRTNTYYTESQLPSLQRHLKALLAASDWAITKPISDFLDHIIIAMAERAQKELQVLENSLQLNSVIITELMEETSQIVDQLTDLRTLLIKHAYGRLNQDLAYAVIYAISTLKKQIIIHNRIYADWIKPSCDV